MLKFSHASRYAISALVSLATADTNGLVTSDRIASDSGLSEPFLLKVLQHLVRARLLQSLKGPRGGYTLARPPAEISLLEIVEAVEGPIGSPLPPTEAEAAQGAQRRLQTVLDRAADEVRGHWQKVTVAELAGTRGARPGRKRQVNREPGRDGQKPRPARKRSDPSVPRGRHPLH